MRTGALAAGALLALASCATPSPAPSRSTTSRTVGQHLELTLAALDGGEVSLRQTDGRVRVLDFWATWCEPCREALPEIDRLSRELGPRGLVAYAVSIDETRDVIAPFLAGLHRRLTLAVLWDASGEAMGRAIDAKTMPVTVVLDRAGVVRHLHQGWKPGQDDAVRAEVLELLGGAD